ncbi:MAG: hypothetical protein MUD14_20450 [Hydrococcus sp. Prado102]|jgi:predicted N-acetyltransferase YhbS|nr:hypothetical protein [Hydrococcus sp. Prado102]
MIIRSEMLNDLAGIRDVIEKAFDRQAEANLIDALRYRQSRSRSGTYCF